MGDDKTIRRGGEAEIHRNMEDSFEEVGDGPATRREKYRNDVFKDKYADEDGDPDSKDNMQWAREEHADMIRDGDADVLFSAKAAGRTTGTTGTAGAGRPPPEVEDISRFEEPEPAPAGGKAPERGKSKLARMYYRLQDRIKKEK